jgi:hypothetical protein
MKEARLKVVNVDSNLEYAEERNRIEAVGAELILKKVRTEDDRIEACAAPALAPLGQIRQKVNGQGPRPMPALV